MVSAQIKKIAVTGGKGGTGKSTVAILLVNKLLKEGKKVVLVDCDVECPNEYLLLNQKLRKAVTKITAEFPKLNKAKCKKCGVCVKNCKSNAIFQAPGEYPVFIKSLCSGCGLCWNICPFGAISPKKEETGKIYANKIKGWDFYLITGAVKPGLEETGAAVKAVKEFALRFAEKVKADIIIFDTAAGTHCPVIQALLGVGIAYVVAEPTPMGAYDLDLILNLCRKLKVPVKIILNQANLGNKKEIKKIAKKFNAAIKQEIPYSKKIAQDYAKGRLLGLIIK